MKDIPLGKVSLSKNFLAQPNHGGGEQWVQLAAAETEGSVTGDLHVEVSYYKPTVEVPKHTFSVNGGAFFSSFFFFHFLSSSGPE